MESLYLSISKIIKIIQAEGFSFDEALKIYKTGSKEIQNVDDSNYLFFDALFKIENEWTNATEAYSIYCEWAKKNEVDLISQTKFGTIVSKIVNKKKSNGRLFYEMSVKNEI